MRAGCTAAVPQGRSQCYRCRWAAAGHLPHAAAAVHSPLLAPPGLPCSAPPALAKAIAARRLRHLRQKQSSMQHCWPASTHREPGSRLAAAAEQPRGSPGCRSGAPPSAGSRRRACMRMGRRSMGSPSALSALAKSSCRSQGREHGHGMIKRQRCARPSGLQPAARPTGAPLPIHPLRWGLRQGPQPIHRHPLTHPPPTPSQQGAAAPPPARPRCKAGHPHTPCRTWDPNSTKQALGLPVSRCRVMMMSTICARQEPNWDETNPSRPLRNATTSWWARAATAATRAAGQTRCRRKNGGQAHAPAGRGRGASRRGSSQQRRHSGQEQWTKSHAPAGRGRSAPPPPRPGRMGCCPGRPAVAVGGQSTLALPCTASMLQAGPACGRAGTAGAMGEVAPQAAALRSGPASQQPPLNGPALPLPACHPP